jgi:hypothetical protein
MQPLVDGTIPKGIVAGKMSGGAVRLGDYTIAASDFRLIAESKDPVVLSASGTAPGNLNVSRTKQGKAVVVNIGGYHLSQADFDRVVAMKPEPKRRSKK